MVDDDVPRIVSATREIAADPERVFELVADPAQHPRWDGNDNLAEAAPGQRVRAVGDVFVTRLLDKFAKVADTLDRSNRVVEFEEERRVAWRPSVPGQPEPGHLWRWEVEPAGEGRSKVTHTYDWTQLTDEARFKRAMATTQEGLAASIDRLAAIAEAG